MWLKKRVRLNNHRVCYHGFFRNTNSCQPLIWLFWDPDLKEWAARMQTNGPFLENYMLGCKNPSMFSDMKNYAMLIFRNSEGDSK